MPTLAAFFQHSPEVPNKRNKAVIKKSKQKEVKLLLLAHEMITYIENPKDYTQTQYTYTHAHTNTQKKKKKKKPFRTNKFSLVFRIRNQHTKISCVSMGNGMEFSQKTQIELPYALVVPLLGIYPKQTITGKDAFTSVFTPALFTISNTWKQPKCPSTEKWIKKVFI